MAEALVARSTGCPSCGDKAEPEEEDGVVKFVCPCGYEFGHRRLSQEADECSLGIPEQVRRDGQPGQVFLGGIGRRPE